MASARGFRVQRLVRTAIGRLELERLSPGDFVVLDGEALMEMILHGGSV
jgi:16S rRNA U516 pseudouridylate synthase RsuA-like enzyme